MRLQWGGLRLIALSVTMSAVGLLTACGGGGDDSLQPDARVFSEGPNDTMSKRVSDATTESAALRFEANMKGLSWEAGSASAIPDEIVAITTHRASPTAAPLVKVATSRGETIFNAEDYNSQAAMELGYGDTYVIRVDDGSLHSLWSWGGNWLEYADGNTQYQYLIPIGIAHTSTPAGGSTDFFTVIGLEPDPGNLTLATSAAFDGESRINFFSVDNGDFVAAVRTDLTLNVDFGAQTISGRLHGFQSRRDGVFQDLPTNPNQVINILETRMDGNGFSTTLAYDPTSCDNATPCAIDGLPNSFFEGKFYGNAAQESGGTLGSGEYVSPSSGSNLIGTGVWYAKDDEQQ